MSTLNRTMWAAFLILYTPVYIATAAVREPLQEGIETLEFTLPCLSEETAFHCKLKSDIKDAFIQAALQEITNYPTEQYNLLIAELLLKYQQAFVRSDFNKMKSIMTLSAYMDQLTEHERQGNWVNHPVAIVMDDIFWAWTLSAGVGTLKGVGTFKALKNSGKQAMIAFEEAVKKTASGLPKKKEAMIITGFGASAGVPHAVYAHLKNVKLSGSQKVQAMNVKMLSDTFNRVKVVRLYPENKSSLKKIPEILKLSNALVYFKSVLPQKSMSIDAATEALLIKSEKLYSLSQ